MNIRSLNANEAQELLPQLFALLKDSVDTGASIGFILPLSQEEGMAYWNKRIAVLEAGESIMLIVEMGGQIVGTGQLAIESRANGRHRAEVQKVLTHSEFRRRGIGKAIMLGLEKAAIERNLRLLFLDTRRGDPSELLYQNIGYEKAGIIPEYVINENGSFEDTVIYYKLLS
jgi:acetyltransferase